MLHKTPPLAPSVERRHGGDDDAQQRRGGGGPGPRHRRAQTSRAEQGDEEDSAAANCRGVHDVRQHGGADAVRILHLPVEPQGTPAGTSAAGRPLPRVLRHPRPRYVTEQRLLTLPQSPLVSNYFYPIFGTFIHTHSTFSPTHIRLKCLEQ